MIFFHLLPLFMLGMEAQLQLQQAQTLDFQSLAISLKRYFEESPIERIPLLVRMSFHDLSMLTTDNSIGPNGCLFSDLSFLQIPDNFGFSLGIEELKQLIVRDFPGISFSPGDVISFAGKIAVESSIPGTIVAWEFGRSHCGRNASDAGQIPRGDLTSVDKLRPFLLRYNLSLEEMGILISGAHGLAGAKADPKNSGFGRENLQSVFASISSGTDWIRQTVGHWSVQSSLAGKTQFSNGQLLRLPSDFIFFPSVAGSLVPNHGGSPIDMEAADVERKLRTINTEDFNRVFAATYSKMLRIGTNASQLTRYE